MIMNYCGNDAVILLYMFGEQQDFKWFSTLSPEEQHRLAPSYIAILQEQLANAHIRQKKLLAALDYFNPPYYPEHHYFDKYKACRNCFAISKVSDVHKCDGCYNNWGCIECNTDDKLVIACPSCYQHICEECDPHVKLTKELDWKCTACYYSSLIMQDCQLNMLKLREGTITRNQAIVVWKPPPTINCKISDLTYSILAKKFRDSDYWMVFCGNADFELEEDFPNAEDDNAIVVCPLYEHSPHIQKLITEVANRVFAEEDHADYIKTIFDDHLYDAFYIARTTITVKELLGPFLDNEHITEERWTSLGQELLDSILN